MGRQPSSRQVSRDIESIDDHACTVLHIDMDAFFAAVELQRHPELAGRPMMVAGDAGRGVVLSANYEARRYGVASAMPTDRAKARCPGIAIVPPDQHAYREVSRQVMSIFHTYTACVEQVSVDEAFLDVSGARRTRGRPGAIGARIRHDIADTLGLTATVGAASTKFVAKLASSLAKPDGMLIVPPDEVMSLLRPLPVRALWGVGPRTDMRLRERGFETIGDIADTSLAALRTHIGRSLAHKLFDLSHGRDSRRVEPTRQDVSIGAEQTFATDIRDLDEINRVLLGLAVATGRRLRQAGLAGRTLALKVRFDDFTTITRSESSDSATCQDRVLHAAAKRCFQRAGVSGRPIRLLGVRMENLVPANTVSEQLSLTENPEHGDWHLAQQTLDEIADRFGSVALKPASLINSRQNRP